MKYAVISISGKQQVVTEGEKLQVDRLEAKDGDTLEIKDVLLNVDGDKVQIGTPLVEGSKVSAKVVSHERGIKIRVATFKAKSRQRRVKGHRQELTTLEILSIS